MRELNLDLDSVAITERLGTALATALVDQPGRCWVLLHGELGAGKSTLARALLRGAGVSTPIPSPTYTLVEPYIVAHERPAVHVDLYRLGSADELDELGYSDWDTAIALIEWAERAPELAAKADLDVRLTVTGPASRAGLLTALSAVGQRLLRHSALAQVQSE
ncbi:MAG: tRNA (adenosine(37)-N6)-threonylcarbamoyltransferase complex ATPase subunit type 1 TsaE [Pseudomonadota bacterium]